MAQMQAIRKLSHIRMRSTSDRPVGQSRDLQNSLLNSGMPEINMKEKPRKFRVEFRTPTGEEINKESNHEGPGDKDLKKRDGDGSKPAPR